MNRRVVVIGGGEKAREKVGDGKPQARRIDTRMAADKVGGEDVLVD